MNTRKSGFLVRGALFAAIVLAFPLVSGAADTSAPVQCKDGTSSPHGGRGACSGHGGIDKSATGGGFDFGLPFFMGRHVFTAIEGQSTSAGNGPYMAY